MTTDWTEVYKTSVLEPARKAGNIVTRDLLVRYALEGVHMSDAGRFTTRVEETVRYWKKLATTRRLYKPLADALLAAHADLKSDGALTREAFTERQEKARKEATEQAARWIQVIAGTQSCVTLSTLRELVSSSGVLSEADVRVELDRAALTVVEPEWDVPTRPPVATAAALAGNLNILGLEYSPQVIFTRDAVGKGFRLKDGFRLSDGRVLGTDAIDKARAEQAQRPHNERKTAAENVLATLGTAAKDPATLGQLLRWELCQLLLPKRVAGLPVQLIADLAVAVGLDKTEATELAVTLATDTAGSGTQPEQNDSDLVAELLRQQRLREAEAVVATLPPGAVDEAVRVRVAKAVAEVDTLVAGAEREQVADRAEEAARLLAKAVRIAADDTDLAGRLSRITPPPPADLTADLGNGRAALRWTPSAALTGTISYRVVRGADTVDGGHPVAETVDNTAVDPDPPVADIVTYTVFASRDGAMWSPGTAGPAGVLLPAVSDLVLDVDGDAVTGSWRNHPAATGAEVRRAVGNGPYEQLPPAAGGSPPSGFVDRDLRPGENHRYRVTAVYTNRADDRLESDFVEDSIVPEPERTAVTDLVAEHVEDGRDGPARLRLSWTPPQGGAVEVRRAQGPPPWAPGTTVPRQRANSHGEPVQGAQRVQPSGRCSVVVPAGTGRATFTALTLGSGNALVGNTVSVDLIATVKGLRARRRADVVSVMWLWPPGAHEARVRWSCGDRSDMLTCSFREFRDNGGVAFECGPEATTITVEAVIRAGGREMVSPAATVQVDGRLPVVTWSLLRVGPLRRRVALLLRCDCAHQVPDLLVSTVDRDLPDAETREIARIPQRWLPAGTVARVDLTGRVQPHELDAGSWNVTEADSDTPSVTLVRDRTKR